MGFGSLWCSCEGYNHPYNVREVISISPRKAVSEEKDAELARLQTRVASLDEEVKSLKEEIARAERKPGQKKFRILALDGGGMRGLITALILQRLEEECPGMLGKVDLISGTSTGAIAASFLAKGQTPTDIATLYKCWGSKIFSTPGLGRSVTDLGGIVGPRYSPAPLKAALEETFGTTKMNELNRKVLIPAFDCDGEPIAGEQKGRKWSAKFFHNSQGEGVEQVVDVVLASTAAPTYFPLHKGFADGGLIAQHPVMPAVAHACHPRSGSHSIDDIVVLNVGTGDINEEKLELKKSDLGVAQWILPLLNILFSGQQEVMSFEGSALLGRRFHRVSPFLESGNDADCWKGSEENMAKMRSLIAELDLSSTVSFVKEQWMADSFSGLAYDPESDYVGL